jgi:uncharacterized protein (DUF697 family)
MAGLRAITNTWNTVTEFDLRPYREQAERGVRLALVGKPGSGGQQLAERMRRDPYRLEIEQPTPLLVVDLEEAAQLPETDLVILLLHTQDSDDAQERRLVRAWLDSGRRVLVVINRPTDPPEQGGGLAVEPWLNWGGRNVLVGAVESKEFLLKQFVPAVLNHLPELSVPLGRNYPLFRTLVARHLVNDACISNAAYSLSTGIAQMVPIFNIPLNVADIFVLTKNQIFLVYKMGLSLGMSTEFQSYVAAFGGVLGGGFFWRQAARMLIGLIPGFGIIPKAAISYAGTYVVGTTVLQWYLTGGHIPRGQIRQLYAQAYSKGKLMAQNLFSRRPRLGAGRGKQPKAVLTPSASRPCAQCGKPNAADASYCQYCGKLLVGELPG